MRGWTVVSFEPNAPADRVLIAGTSEDVARRICAQFNRSVMNGERRAIVLEPHVVSEVLRHEFEMAD